MMRIRHPFLLVAVALPAMLSCRVRGRADVPPPAAEFVLTAGDSAYWVATTGRGVTWKGAPLALTQVDGRFFELYVVDEDQSFQGADLIGQQVYRRDLRTGDSVLVYRDTTVPRLAREYARLHPDDRRLDHGEEPDADATWRATATVELGAVHGPFVSFHVHTDVVRDSTALWHTSRRGVLDLRSNRVATLADVVGAEADGVERRRDAAFRIAVDSVRSSPDARGALASTQLAHYRVDPGSFEITSAEGAPAIAYGVPGSGTGDAGHLLPLAPIRFAEPAWWKNERPSRPRSSADGSRDVWRHGAYDVVVRYDASGGGRLVVRDSTSREWSIGPIASPATRIFWLDRPAVDATTRTALTKAFRDAASYGDENRVAVAGFRESRPRTAGSSLRPVRANSLD